MNKRTDHSSFSKSPLQEGEDFYYNDAGLMVLTSKYHLKRGYCCKSDCTHCPFETSQEIDPNIPQEFQTNWSENTDENIEDDEGKYEIDPDWGID